MPETPHHAIELTVSLADNITATMYDELKEYQRKKCLWYALKAENGESGKTHIHGAFVYEIVHYGDTQGGGRTLSNFKREVTNHCPVLKQYLVDNPSKFALVAGSMKSDQFIAEYLQKEGELSWFNLPQDLQLLNTYFSDLQVIKPKNPEFEAWKNMYEAENRELPCSFESAWKFFGEHMYVPMEVAKVIKIVSDKKKLSERCESFMCYLNMEVPELPKKRKFNDADSKASYNCRVCPRCIENDYDAPNILDPREQFCKRCKKY